MAALATDTRGMQLQALHLPPSQQSVSSDAPLKHAVVASAVVPAAVPDACSDGAAETAEAGASGWRVPEALCQLLPQQFPTASAAKRAVRRGQVLLDGCRASTNTRVQPGQRLQALERVRAPPPPPAGSRRANGVPAAPPLEVAFEDDHLACVVKPQCVPTQAPGGPVLDAYSRLPHSLRISAAPGVLARPRHAHRLDALTGGLLLVGKTQPAVAALCRMFVERKVAKRYRAAVYGRMTGSGTFDWDLDGKFAVTRWAAVAHLPAAAADWQQAASGTAAVACDDGSNGSSRGAHGGRGGDSGGDVAGGAVTQQLCSGVPPAGAAIGDEASQGFTILDLWPTTGRRHQLRRHLARAGHPILGDGQHTGGHPAAVAASKAAAAERRQPQPDAARAGGSELPGRDTSVSGLADNGSGGGDAGVSGADAPALVHTMTADRDGSGSGPHDEALLEAANSSSGIEAGPEEDSARLFLGRQRLALWAVELRLQHPITHELLHLTLPRQQELAGTCPELTIVSDG